MGAFLLVKKPAGMEAERVEEKYKDALKVFDKRGLSLNQKIVKPDFVLYTFHKNKFKVDNTLIFDDGQFIAATGSMFYKKKMGQAALKELFKDYSTKNGFLADILGQYGLIIYKNGELYISNDYTGLYHIFTNQDKSVISSSFLALLKTLPQRTVAMQELYEYVIGGSPFGGKTPIKEIELLDHRGVFQLYPEKKFLPKPSANPPYVKRFEDVSSMEKMAQELAEDLASYFSAIKSNLGNDVCSPLTGGVHTRMMLGCMKRNQIKPAYMYIFGDPNNKTGRDANAFPIAASIAKDEGLTLDFMDTTIENRVDLKKYHDYIEQSYYLGDGLGHEVGLFHKSFNPELRLNRADKAKLILNGAGGEAFRNYWVLPDRPYHIDTFIKSRYDSVDDSMFAEYNRETYFSIYRDKIKKSLDTDVNMLSRKQVELVQPDFENRYWMGNNNSINNAISYYLTPFGDTHIVYRACDVPVKFKDMSAFEGALMRAIDPALAKYPTAQGVDLLKNHTKFSTRMNNTARQHIPIWLKAYLRKHFYNGAGESLRIGGNSFELPYNFSEEYLDQIFPKRDLTISEYFNIDSINNPAVLSRALTADLVINNRF